MEYTTDFDEDAGLPFSPVQYEIVPSDNTLVRDRSGSSGSISSVGSFKKATSLDVVPSLSPISGDKPRRHSKF